MRGALVRVACGAVAAWRDTAAPAAPRTATAAAIAAREDRAIIGTCRRTPARKTQKAGGARRYAPAKTALPTACRPSVMKDEAQAKALLCRAAF